MKKLLIKNGRVIDPANNIDDTLDILIEGDKIARINKKISDGQADLIDATRLIVTPGFIDMHVHLREPGREDKETIRTGSWAAAAGGDKGRGKTYALLSHPVQVDCPDRGVAVAAQVAVAQVISD